MRQVVVLFFVLVVCGWAPSVTRGQQTQGQSAVSSRECVAVIGAVNMPGRFELKRRIRLLEALAFAGGFTKNAGLTVRVIITGSKCPRETREVNEPAPTPNVRTYSIADLNSNEEAVNPYLEAGDIVVVDEADCAYIGGAVVQPQQIVLRRPVTLTQAIAIAGGLRKEATVEKVRIYRHTRGSAERLELLMNLKAVREKRSADIVLQSDDVVEVPGLSPHGPMFFLPFDAPLPVPRADRVIYGLRSVI
jgi:protein involved in polysaccharide export with SLBB domain